MPRSLRRALVRGRPAQHWHHYDGHLILRGPRRGEETTVPITHLVDDVAMAEHVLRLRDKSWVMEHEITELLEIARGARG